MQQQYTPEQVAIMNKERDIQVLSAYEAIPILINALKDLGHNHTLLAYDKAREAHQERLTRNMQFFHDAYTGEPDKAPQVDEELVSFLGQAVELMEAMYHAKSSTDIRFMMPLKRAIEMGNRLGNDHRSSFIPYSVMVENLFKKMDTAASTLMHAGVGVAGEGGEVLDAIKKHWVYGIPMDAIVNKETGQTLVQLILEEVGDSYFYLQKILNIFGWTWADVRNANRMKLAKRYPEGVYSDAHAQARLDKQE